jgi:predicted ATPase
VLRHLRLRNFKAWQDTGAIKFAPLTLFFGANSSGKSSINHFLMLLKQTVRSPDRNNVFDFGDENAPVQLGSFRDVIFAHEVDREISFGLTWQLPSQMTIRDPRSRRRYTGDQLAFVAKAGLSTGRLRTVQSEGFRYRLKSGDDTVLGVRMRRDPKRTNRWRLDTEDYELVRTKGRAWELPRPVQFYGFPDEAAIYYQNTLFLSELELALEERLGSISYLGPLRVPAARLYSWPGNVPPEVGWRGENAVQALLAATDRKLNWKRQTPLQDFQVVVATWLARMGLVESFAVDEIAPDRSEYEVLVRTSETAEEVKLTDVGFGVSQALPVIVQCFYATPNSTVLVEQPEIHLHPSVQSSLADLFVAAISAREDGAPRGVQLIVESHSEHLLRRLQRLIAEEKVSKNDVAIYFCYPGPNGSDVDLLELNEYGDIINWPPDFFGDELEDVAVQAQVGMQRRLDIKE